MSRGPTIGTRWSTALSDPYGAVNALVNNAGRAPRVRADLLEASEESFDELVRTNLQGPYFLTQAIAREQLARRAGDAAFRAVIVFVTSISAERHRSIAASTASAKQASRWPRDCSPCGSQSTASLSTKYDPGIIDTDMTAGVRDTYTKRIDQGLVPERRWGHPDDIGRVVRSLVRGDLPVPTGSVINVDGGLSLPTL